MAFHCVPVLHGSDLLRDFEAQWEVSISDDHKIEVVKLLLSEFVNHGGKFLRLGCYEDSLSFLQLNGQKLEKEKAIEFLLNHLFSYLGPRTPNPFLFVHEIDKEALARAISEFGRNLDAYHLARDANISLSVDPDNFLGYHHAPKWELGCQAADLSGYIALKSENYATDFSRKLAEVFQNYSKHYEINQILEFKTSK